MAKEKRFEEVYKEGIVTVAKIIVDKKTGVNYLWYSEGAGGGLTPLLDAYGKPIISAVER